MTVVSSSAPRYKVVADGQPRYAATLASAPRYQTVLSSGPRVVEETAFSPSDIAGLVAWFKADAITGLNDGDPVVTWEDSGASGNDVTQGTASKRPAYRTGIQNGLAVVRFDGTDDWLSNAAPTGFTGWSGVTVFVVGARSGAPAFGMMAVVRRSFTELRWDINGTKPQWLGADQLTATTWGSVVSGWHIYHGDFDDTANERSLRVDGATPVSESDTATFNQPNVIDIGARNGTYLFAGDLGEVLIYNSRLSSADVDSVEAYLAARWGVTLV